MVKSKFQAKAQVKVGVKAKVKKPKSKYYDEHIPTSQSSKSNKGFAVFVIVCIIIGASVSGILIANNKQNEDPDPSGGIKDGDKIHLKYAFYIDWSHDLEFTNDELMDDADDFEWIVEEDSEQGFPPGLYYNILGMKRGDTKFIIIPANVDNNGDGIDDITKIPVWEGEDSLGQYNLQFYIEILKIN